jgi:hypothetical protein
MTDDLESLFDELDDDQPDHRINIPDELETPTTNQILAPVQIEDNGPAIDVVKYHRKLEEVTEDVLVACKKDRAEIQEVVDLMFDEIRNDREAGRNPSRGYTDNLTKLLEVKANVNMLAVKIMEANSKMLAATKAGAVTVNNNNNMNVAGDDFLKQLLAQPMLETDDY